MAAALRSRSQAHLMSVGCSPEFTQENPQDSDFGSKKRSGSLSSGGLKAPTGSLFPAQVPPSPTRGTPWGNGQASPLAGSTPTGKGMMRMLDDPLPSEMMNEASGGSRPGSALRQQAQQALGMVRLPSDIRSRPGTPLSPLKPLNGATFSPGGARSGSQPRPSSGGLQPGKATLSRLPDAVSGGHRPGERGMPVSAAAQLPATLASPSSGGHRSTARDRMRMKLSVNTEDAGARGAPAVFRLLLAGESVHDMFEFAEELQQCGNRGRVVCAKRRSDQSEVVVKIRTKRANKSNERSWRAIMTQMFRMSGSRNVLDITEILEDETCFYVVMPKCNGGELFEFLITEAEVPESECKRIVREILAAVGHLHENNLIHRDLKPENLLFNLESGVPRASPKTVKLIDFDTCVEWTPQTPSSKHFVGTPGYIAPEALLGEASPQSDLWSVGVILYILMTGETPWTQIESLKDGTVGSPGAARMYNSLRTANMDWEGEPWPSFPLARDLCQKLTAFKTEDRLDSVNEALSHEWLADA